MFSFRALRIYMFSDDMLTKAIIQSTLCSLENNDAPDTKPVTLVLRTLTDMINVAHRYSDI